MQTTLSDVIVGMGVALRDNLFGTTSGDSAVVNQMVDSRRVSQTDNIWVGSEVLFINPPASMQGPNPNVVTAFNAATGIFTLRDGWGTSGVPGGVKYVMMKLRGRGYPYDYRVQAIRYVLESMSDNGLPVDLLLGTGQANVFTYTIPAGIDTLYAVRTQSLDGATRYWERTIKKRHGRGYGWELRPGRQLFINDPTIPTTMNQIIVSGRYYGSFTGDLNTVIPVNKDAVIRGAVEYLTLLASNQSESRAHDNLMQERIRTEAEYWHANEERIY